MLPLLAALIPFLFLLPSAPPRPQDDVCLACHGQSGFISSTGKKIEVNPARHASSVHAPLGCTACHSDLSGFPHPKKIQTPDCATCHAEAAADVPKSLHGKVFAGGRGSQSCLSCHGNVHEVKKAAAGEQLCSSCHAGVVAQFQQSTHATARRNGTDDAPLCASCHGPAHKILPHTDPTAPTAKKNLPATCGACHANPDFLSRHRIAFARPVEAFRLSIHGRALEAGNQRAPSCSDCHASHAIFKASDARSGINHWRVPETCGACHTEIKNAYSASVHGEAVARGVTGAPVCTDCHGEHTILAPSEPGSLVNPARVSSVTCGSCHSDERLVKRLNLPADRVPTFQDSFHGLASRSGRQTVANCASCHGVHNILRSSDTRSTIHPANLARTCGQCHPGAGQRFAIGPVHVKADSESEHQVVRFIRVSYLWFIIPLTLGFMLAHNALDFISKLVRGAPRFAGGEMVERMNLWFRIAHWMVQISFVTLVYSGFVLKFPEAWWAQPLTRWEASLELRGLIHRLAAVVMIAAVVFHAVHLAVRRRDRIFLGSMVPTLQDVKDFIALVKYNLGRSSERPAFGRFSYAEKIEYLAFLWGTVVMSLTGFLLWFESFTLRNFPSWVADAATALHWYEAILATLAILIWHFYGVIFDPEIYPMDTAWITGKVPVEHLRHSRPLYYAELMAARALRELPAAQAATPAASSAANPAAENPSRKPEKS